MEELHIGASVIPYRIERSARRRSIAITVHPQQGVVVKAPPWAAKADIEHFVRLKAGWISKHLTIFAAMAPPAVARRIEDGMALPLWGRELRLALELHEMPGPRRSRAILHGEVLRLQLRLPPGADSEAAAREALRAWYRRQARLLLLPRVRHYAALLGLPEPPVFIREQQRRWGSCSPRGEIRLNWRIILGPPELADYLCAHEVCHLRELNHSPRYWRLLGSILPDYKALRQRLKLEGQSYTL